MKVVWVHMTMKNNTIYIFDELSLICCHEVHAHSILVLNVHRRVRNILPVFPSFNTTTEVPLIKAPNPQLLPGRHSINGCPLLRVCVYGVCVFTAVCVHLGWVKCRAQIQSMGNYTWLYVTSLTFTFHPQKRCITL